MPTLSVFHGFFVSLQPFLGVKDQNKITTFQNLTFCKKVKRFFNNFSHLWRVLYGPLYLEMISRTASRWSSGPRTPYQPRGKEPRVILENEIRILKCSTCCGSTRRSWPLSRPPPPPSGNSNLDKDSPKKADRSTKCFAGSSQGQTFFSSSSWSAFK